MSARRDSDPPTRRPGGPGPSAGAADRPAGAPDPSGTDRSQPTVASAAAPATDGGRTSAAGGAAARSDRSEGGFGSGGEAASAPAGDVVPPRTGRPQGWVDGVRIGVDVGTVRVGVAASDPDGVLATPLTTLARDPRGAADLTRLAQLVADRHAVEVVVGLPTALSGRPGPAARAARDYATALAQRVHPVPVRLSDERLTTVAATRRLAEAGTRGRKGRSVVDRSAAVLILQGWLDGARRAQ